MFLIDDILLAPVKGLMAIGQKINDAAHQDLDDQEKSIVQDLSELHQLLEAGRIGDEDFNTRETALLDRLETVQDAKDGDTARSGQGGH